MKLEGNRLILRDWKITDISDLFYGLNNLCVSKWLTLVPYPYTKQSAKSWINYCQKNSKKRKGREAYHFAIELKSEKKVIGGIGLTSVNIFGGTASGGIWLNEKYHGQGYGTEAYNQLVKFGFTKLKLRRIDSSYFKGNKSSANLHKKVGFKFEGVRRKKCKSKATGKIHDDCMMGLLKEDWIKRKK